MRTQYTELKLIEEAIHMAENTLLSIENPSDAVLSALDYLDDVLCGLRSEKLLGAKLAPQNDEFSLPVYGLIWDGQRSTLKKPPSNCSLKTAHN